MNGAVVARVRRVLTGHSDRSLVHAVDDDNLEYKIEVPSDVLRNLVPGQEHMLMLAGTLQDEDSGALYHPGDLLRMEPGSEHAFTVLPPHDGVFAILLHESWPLFTGN